MTDQMTDEFDEVLATWIEKLESAESASAGDVKHGYLHDFGRLQSDAARFPELLELLRLYASVKQLPRPEPDPVRFARSLERIRGLEIPQAGGD